MWDLGLSIVASGHRAGHPLYPFTRDMVRYEQDRQYLAGWNERFTLARCDDAAGW